ncbi:unnamed protein product [Sphagnum jensenii]|uniref:Uncharacterized protein n=1 Tax=Sphagnum jensenii TaxID=128206 RepID=A0ABP0VE51_9BRYO
MWGRNLYRKLGYTEMSPDDFVVSFTESRLQKDASLFVLLKKSFEKNSSGSGSFGVTFCEKEQRNGADITSGRDKSSDSSSSCGLSLFPPFGWFSHQTASSLNGSNKHILMTAAT